MSIYQGREQTQAKHFVLKHYLQALSFKVLSGVGDITYVDGFSGPWESQTEDFSDTSFMIAIDVLKDAQQRIQERTGVRRTIRCFFAEASRATYDKLTQAVLPFHKPADGFEIGTYFGRFEDAVPSIKQFIGRSFPLIFIDPTGWTGYPFPRIRSLFHYGRCEVLINFMYAFVSRFVSSPDEKTIASLDPILGGPGWRHRLDSDLLLGPAVEKLFRETLKREGGFSYVVSTKIDKSTDDRPHFFLAYGTKNRAGLKAFRETEFAALREHARARGAAKDRLREERSGSKDLFAGLTGETQESSIDDIVEEQKALAKVRIKSLLADTPVVKFTAIADSILEAFMLREPNVKDVCCELAAEGFIQNTWGKGNRKPNDDTIIQRV